MSVPSSDSSNPSVEVLQDRANRITQQLADQQAKMDRGSRLTAIIGSIILVVLCGYFYYGYSKIFEVLEPELLVQAVEGTVLNTLPTLREQLQERVDQDAETWTQQASDQLVELMPTGRELIENHIVDALDEAMTEAISLTGKEFRKFATENRSMLREGFGAMADEEKAHQFLTELQPALEAQLGTDMRTQADELLATVYHLNSRVDDLKKGQKLSEEDTVLRQILMMARALQIQAADPELAKPGTKWQAPTAVIGVTQEAQTAAKAKPEKPVAKPKADKPAAKPAVKKEMSKPQPAKPAAKPKTDKPAAKPAVKKEMSKPQPAKPAAKPTADKPAAKPAAKKEAPKSQPAKPAEKPKADKPAAKPEVKKEAPKSQPAKPAEKPKADKPAAKPEVKKEASKPQPAKPAEKPKAGKPAAKPAAKKEAAKPTEKPADKPKDAKPATDKKPESKEKAKSSK